MPFEAVLSRGADRAQTQRFKQTLFLAFVVHAMLFCGAALRGGWHVEELSAPVRPLILLQPPRIQPNALPASQPAAAEAKQRQRRKQPETRAPVVVAQPQPHATSPTPTAASPTPSVGGPSSDTNTAGEASRVTEGVADEGGGTGTAVAVVPPKVGAQRCLNCPLPQLPPAFLHVVSKATLACKICVDKAGRVSSVDVRQGISSALDAQVVNAVSAWRFAPITINENPVPFCYPAVFVWQSVP